MDGMTLQKELKNIVNGAANKLYTELPDIEVSLRDLNHRNMEITLLIWLCN